MAVVVEYCHVEPARAPVYLVRPCLCFLHAQLVSQRLRLALVGVVGHILQHPQHGESIQRPRLF